ncbi:MAG: NHL repeat-containing protein [Sulfuricaulis sp.]
MFKKHGVFALLLFSGAAAIAYAYPSFAAQNRLVYQPRVVAEAGWSYHVAAQDLPGVDNLAMAADGKLYATQELPPGTAKVIQIHHNEIITVFSDLNRADGLLLHGKYLYITEGTPDGRVIEFDLLTKKQRVLTTLHSPAGIDIFPNGDLLVSENTLSGRLLRVRRTGDKNVDVIFSGLSRPQGVAVNPDGTVIFAETDTGRVLSYKDGVVNVVVDDLDEPDQVEIAPDGALWITEDVHNGRLMRLKNGALETVLSGLYSPQGIAFGAGGTVWLAEHGRQRILVIHGKVR